MIRPVDPIPTHHCTIGDSACYQVRHPIRQKSTVPSNRNQKTDKRSSKVHRLFAIVQVGLVKSGQIGDCKAARRKNHEESRPLGTPTSALPVLIDFIYSETYLKRFFTVAHPPC